MRRWALGWAFRRFWKTYFFRRRPFDLILHPIRRIRHLLKWLPIIWRDYDFDWVFLITLMIAKMRFMAEVFDRGVSEGSAERAAELRAVAELLERVKRDDYVGDVVEQELHQKADLQTALSIIERRLLWWWD